MPYTAFYARKSYIENNEDTIRKFNIAISFGLGNLEIVKDVTSYRETYDLTEYASYDFDSLVISGTYSSTLDNQVLSINGHDVSVGEFEVDLGTDVTELVLNLILVNL